jgi:hypothetical protein
MAERDALNSEILAKTPLSRIWERLCLNALGELDPPLTQTEQMSIQTVLKKHIPDQKAVELTGDLDTTINLMINKGYAPKPADD